MEITAEEAEVIRRAQDYMGAFETRHTKGVSASFPFTYRERPAVPVASDELTPVVYGVAEIFGIAFSQGIVFFDFLQNSFSM
jgi:hypothetical protein